MLESWSVAVACLRMLGAAIPASVTSQRPPPEQLLRSALPMDLLAQETEEIQLETPPGLPFSYLRAIFSVERAARALCLHFYSL